MMNNLSWMIYAADIAGDIEGLAGIIAGLSLIAFILAVVTWAAEEYARETCAKAARVAAIVFGIAASIAIAIPSQTTIYAIAASEYGETALQSETGGKAVEALNAWLDRQITPQERNHD
jgi:hypothetical protein